MTNNTEGKLTSGSLHLLPNVLVKVEPILREPQIKAAENERRWGER